MVDYLKWVLINDITTSYEHPPLFLELQSQNPSINYSYPSHFKKEQDLHYSRVKPLNVGQTQHEKAYLTTLLLAQSQSGWNVTFQDSTLLRIGAVATTPLLRFKDDILIEVRKESGQTVIHMRSRSRVGRSDFGANAVRIENFMSQLKKEIEN